MAVPSSSGNIKRFRDGNVGLVVVMNKFLYKMAFIVSVKPNQINKENKEVTVKKNIKKISV